MSKEVKSEVDSLPELQCVRVCLLSGIVWGASRAFVAET